jgi:drug/metabolite transporter (DMT)-like permease
MPLLLLVSVIWAFSFGLTKGKLAGLDSAFISAARLALSLLVFLPFLRLRGVSLSTGLKLIAIGAVQFGLMYLAYNESYRHLAAYEVALFTLTTPLLVTLLADALDRTLRPRALVAALLAVVAAALVVAKSATVETTALGFALVQLANGAFAVGQVFYRRLRARETGLRDAQIFALLYFGAVAVTAPLALWKNAFALPTLTAPQLGTLLYLGVLASGVGFFWWNLGSTRVSAGTLAVFNNAKVPLGVACSLVFFGEQADLPRLALGGAFFLVSLAVSERRLG